MSVNYDAFGHLEAEEVTSAKTLDEGDSGIVQDVTATATVTLPATALGLTYPIRVGAEEITVTVSPNASDKIMGNGFTSADNKDLVFTSQPASSFVTLFGDGADGWTVQRIFGTATRET